MLVCPSVERYRLWTGEVFHRQKVEPWVYSLSACALSIRASSAAFAFAALSAAAAASLSALLSLAAAAPEWSRWRSQRTWRRLARAPKVVAGRPEAWPLSKCEAAQSCQARPEVAQEPSWGATKGGGEGGGRGWEAL